jgi:UDP-3-O-[3-hydroxymyristoyl] N-acetylglucosamine deacetylase
VVASFVARELYRATEALRGRCLHQRAHSVVRCRPAARGTGIRFIRTDISPAAIVPATISAAVPGSRRTRLRREATEVGTVEHLLAALWVLGIFDAQIDVFGPEIPALDGSAALFARALIAASRQSAAPDDCWEVTSGFGRVQDRSTCHLLPAPSCIVESTIDFEHPCIGSQYVRYEIGDLHTFVRRLAPARTFGFLWEAEPLHARGLIRGAGLQNVLLFDSRGVMNPGGSRYLDEPARHKLVDALGDLSLLGGPLKGRIKLNRCSHRLLIETLRMGLAAGYLRRTSVTDRPDPR